MQLLQTQLIEFYSCVCLLITSTDHFLADFNHMELGKKEIYSATTTNCSASSD